MTAATARRRREGLVVDYGGVLTTSVARSFSSACRLLGIPPSAAKEAVLEAYGDGGDHSAIARLETGRLSAEAFGAHFADLLARRTGVEVAAEGLVARLFAAIEPDEAMLAAVASARAAGVRTALLSNSWGEDGYPRQRFPELFDAVVISGEVGVRKPDPAIYALAAERLGLPPGACAFVDDLAVNVRAAEAAGMHGILHERAERTLPVLADVLGLSPAVLGVAQPASAQGDGGRVDDGTSAP